MVPQRLDPPFNLDALPDTPAVFVVAVREGEPYVGRTTRLRRRLKRLLGDRAGVSRFLSLRDLATSIEIHPYGSRLDASLLFYEIARRCFPETYARVVKLRQPPMVKVLLSNEYPRTQVTTKLSASKAVHYGPFRTRADAERFESEVLDLFQVRRCQEDLVVSVNHPGCIYGEMARCLRPCQQAVSRDEYLSEVQRLVQFLATGGQSLLGSVLAARDRSSNELDFEEAQRQHQRAQRIEQVLKLRGDLVNDIERLNGVAVTSSSAPGFVQVRFLLSGQWSPVCDFRVAPDSCGEMVPLDRRLRDVASELSVQKSTVRDRMDHLALLSRWFYSSWRDGEWIGFSSLDDLPYRKIVRAISRVASAGSLIPQETVGPPIPQP